MPTRTIIEAPGRGASNEVTYARVCALLVSFCSSSINRDSRGSEAGRRPRESNLAGPAAMTFELFVARCPCEGAALPRSRAEGRVAGARDAKGRRSVVGGLGVGDSCPVASGQRVHRALVAGVAFAELPLRDSALLL